MNILTYIWLVNKIKELEIRIKALEENRDEQKYFKKIKDEGGETEGITL